MSTYSRNKRFLAPYCKLFLEQGDELSSSKVAGSRLIDELLGPMPTANVFSRAASALNNMPAASGSSEAPVQEAMVSLFKCMHDVQQRQGQPAMLVWDSHAHGLAISGSSSRAKPDLLLCDAFEVPVNIVTVVEAMPCLDDGSMAKKRHFKLTSASSSFEVFKINECNGF